MANWELQLVHAVMTTGELRKVIKAGIGPSVFGTVEGRAAFDWLLAYSQRPEHFGEVASPQLFRENFPTIELPQPMQSLHALVEKVKEDRLTRQLHEVLKSAFEGDTSVDVSPYACLAALGEKIRTLNATAASSVKVMDFAEEAHDVLLTRYNSAQEIGGITGIPWPWREFAEKVGGIEPSSMNLLIGVPKAGKTWIALFVMAMMWEMFGRRVLIFSREMSLEQLYARLACILARLDYDDWKHARFTREQKDVFFGTLAALKAERLAGDSRRRLIITKGLTNNTAQSLEALRALIDDLEPDAVFLDSAYQMAEDRDWKTLAKLTSGVMSLVADTPVAAIVTIQDNERKVLDGKQGRGTSTVAMTPTWIQDCHFAAKVINNDNGFVTIQPIAAREGFVRSAGFRIKFNPASNMAFHDWKPEKYSGEEGDPQVPAAPAAPAGGRFFAGPPTRTGSTILK